MTPADVGLKVKNPGGDWLQDQREEAASAPACRCRGKLTAHWGMREPLRIATRMIGDLPGARGEQLTRDDDDAFRRLSSAVEAEGWDPDPILVWVAWNGAAFIAEGNHRIAVAKTLGLDEVPVDIRYFAGAEGEPGPMNPDAILHAVRCPEPAELGSREMSYYGLSFTPQP